MVRVLLIVNLLATIAFGVYLFTRPGTKNVYVFNNEVFAKFKGKQLLEDKLKKVREQNKKVLDSLVVLVQRSSDRAAIEEYQATEQEFRINEEELSEQYTAEIWKRINGYLLEFGKENNYGLVFGASGNGTIMYGNDALNVTDDAIEYINKKYEAE